MQDGEPAHARVEDADRPGVHARGFYGASAPAPCGYPSAAVLTASRSRRVVRLALRRWPARRRAAGLRPRPRQDVSIPMDDGVSIAATLYAPGRRAASRRLAGDRLPPRARRQPAADERARRGDTDCTGRELRDPHVRRARPRRVRRARRDRRPARGRRHARRPRLARGAAGRLRHEDRRLGHLRTAAARCSTRSSPACRGPRSSTVETWTDLYTALMPQGLVKSGPRRRARGARSRRATRSVARRADSGSVRRRLRRP